MGEVMPDFLSEARDLFEYTQTLRRDFHRHPELGFQEVRTAGIVARELNELGLEVTTGIAKTGVVALLEGEQPGPVLLLRFDMDALPIREETGAPYASENPGVMHACGHDGHTAVGLTVARILHRRQNELRGTIKLVFQPAEEGLGGAEAMITAGVLENPAPDITLALHVWNHKPVGWIGITGGPTMAAAEYFRLRIIGRGGHGALPHETRDPVLASAQVITALQSIVARNVSPLDKAVLSVTTVHGGDAFNIIPMMVELQGTIRTFTPEVRKVVLERFDALTGGVAGALGCHVESEVKRLTPAVINDFQTAEKVRQAAAEVLPGSLVESDFLTMGSEDMSFMMDKVPGCYFFVGSANDERGLNASHHHPRFDIDEDALPRAAALMAAAAVRCSEV
jgi:amidohydrolase